MHRKHHRGQRTIKALPALLFSKQDTDTIRSSLALAPGVHQRYERGQITVVMAAIIGIIALLMTYIAAISSIALSHAYADNAADFAALAAAATEYGFTAYPGTPCEAARKAAHENKARLHTCILIAGDYRVSVRVDTAGIGFLPAIDGHARAGPKN